DCPAFRRQLEIEMVGAGFFVGEQLRESAWRDERERWDVKSRVAGRQIKALQGGGQRCMAIVQFDPIDTSVRGLGEPFVNDQIRRGGEWLGDVSRVRRR